MLRFTRYPAVVAILLAASIPAGAMPVQTTLQPGRANLTLVAGGCGPAFHRGPLGGCRPNTAVVVARRPICRMVLLPLPHRVCR